jgi:hypothetical protein
MQSALRSIASREISWNLKMINQEGDKIMDTKRTDLLTQNIVFLWIAVGTALLLLVPFVAMRFTNEVNWTPGDFVAMGALIFGISSLFVFVARKVQKKSRLAVGVMFLFAFLWLWAELAVGVFTNWGS